MAISAVMDGETVYSEEVVWYPKLNSDPDYHYEGIVSALKAAAAISRGIRSSSKRATPSTVTITTRKTSKTAM